MKPLICGLFFCLFFGGCCSSAEETIRLHRIEKQLDDIQWKMRQEARREWREKNPGMIAAGT